MADASAERRAQLSDFILAGLTGLPLREAALDVAWGGAVLAQHYR